MHHNNYLNDKPTKLIKTQDDTENCVDEEFNLESLLSLESAREKESKKVGEELLQLLSRPTAKGKIKLFFQFKINNLKKIFLYKFRT